MLERVDGGLAKVALRSRYRTRGAAAGRGGRAVGADDQLVVVVAEAADAAYVGKLSVGRDAEHVHRLVLHRQHGQRVLRPYRNTTSVTWKILFSLKKIRQTLLVYIGFYRVDSDST